MAFKQSFKLKNKSKLAASIAVAIGIATSYGEAALAQEDTI